MKKYAFSIPLRVVIPSGKKYSINKNIERNNHFYLKNIIKQSFVENNRQKLEALPIFEGKVQISYILYKPNKRRMDIDNVLGMCSKFLCDGLVVCGKLPDDNTDVVIAHHQYYGGISKEYPRIVILIEEVE